MSARCTVWLEVATKDLEKAKAALEEPNEENEASWGATELVFEEVRYPGDLIGGTIKAGIPYRKVNDEGEYPAGIEVSMADGNGYLYCQTVEGSLFVPVSRETGYPDPDAMLHVKNFLALEARFYQYCKENQ